jgi:hypothetical protein
MVLVVTAVLRLSELDFARVVRSRWPVYGLMTDSWTVKFGWIPRTTEKFCIFASTDRSFDNAAAISLDLAHNTAGV